MVLSKDGNMSANVQPKMFVYVKCLYLIYIYIYKIFLICMSLYKG